MKIDKCKLFGHKWTPIFIKGKYNNKTVKFIGCFCGRCRKGHDEILEVNELAIDREFGTYNEKYFDRT